MSVARADAIVVGWERALELVTSRASTWERIAAERKAECDALLEKYHALRINGAEAAPVYTVPQLESFGPLTRAALADMGHGQSGVLKRAMRDKALSIWLEHRGTDNQDEITAIAVRQGEVAQR